MTLNKIVIILLCVFLLAGSVFLAVLTWNNLKTNQTAVINPPIEDGFPTVPKPDNDQITTSTTTPQTLADARIAWLVSPVKLADLKLIEYSTDSMAASAGDGAQSYYKVAIVSNGGEIIVAFMQPEGLSSGPLIRFYKNELGKYFLLKKNSDFNDSYLKSRVEVDSEIELNSLNAPQKISLNRAEFTKKSWSDKTPLDWGKLEKIGTTPSGDFYKKLTAAEHSLAYVQYILKLPDSTAMSYDMTLVFLADDNSLIADFKSQDFRTKKFNVLMARGCSAPNAVISVSDLTGRLSVIGATAAGGALYAPKDVNDELFKAVFDDYKIGRTGTTTFDGQPVLTYEELAAKKPVVVWRDGLGDYQVFYDNNYGHLAECGKPVIYLYPESKTEVKVRVGANVRISEPSYDNGWRVVANPDGKIINSDGAVYKNLYWEGLGRGEYPAITQGRVVKEENIEAELRHDLAALGLNENEIEDFMEFWLPKMPETPYIRLTWLNTAEMSALAPLYISPRPETVARVFLDFAGQDTATTNLAPQTLQGFIRIGFTVVEWGGLLIGGK